jgi:hypothetical protein
VVKASTHRRLETLAKGSPDVFGGPVPESEVARAERRLKAKFPADYREFVLRYGGAQLGHLFVCGLRPTELGGPEDLVTTLSERFRSQLLPPFASMVVVAADQGGNPIGFLPPRRAVVTHDHDFGGRHEVAADFEEFLLALLDQHEA